MRRVIFLNIFGEIFSAANTDEMNEEMKDEFSHTKEQKPIPNFTLE